jgi:hypothetical protein
MNDNITIENVRIGFRNFSGKEGKFNLKGDRNFVIFLEESLAKELDKQGWNIRWLKPRNEEEEPQAILQVKVMFGKIPPQAILISSKGRTMLNEENINILDWAELKNVDVIIRPYSWSVSGKSGVKAYLKKMYVTLVEDELEKKYDVHPDAASDAIGGCGNCELCTGDCGAAVL